MSVTPIKNYL